MAPDEMDQDHLPRSGREVLDHIGAKEQDVKELRGDVKELREEIKLLREEIQLLREEIIEKDAKVRAVEEEIASVSGTEVRLSLEAKVQFLGQLEARRQDLRQETILIRQEISSRDKQILILQRAIRSLLSVQELRHRQEVRKG